MWVACISTPKLDGSGGMLPKEIFEIFEIYKLQSLRLASETALALTVNLEGGVAFGGRLLGVEPPPGVGLLEWVWPTKFPRAMRATIL